MDRTAPEGTRISPITVIGLVLLLAPLLTIAHELGGHALTCLATGNRPTELGAYYVTCEGTDVLTSRIVAMAGTGVDLLVALVALLVYPHVRRPLLRLAVWVVMVFKAMTAGGYWLFSGVLGFGDWAPGADGGMGEMGHPWLWRLALVVVGLAFYIAVVRGAMRSIDAFVGGGEQAALVRRRTVMILYLTNGAIAIVVGLFNPVGFFIILVSAIASSFGGTAGLFNVAFRGPTSETTHPVVIERSIPLLVVGALVTIAFAAVLGPTLTPYGG